MSFIAVGVAGASLLTTVGTQAVKANKGKKKELEGSSGELASQAQQEVINIENDKSQAAQQMQMQGLADQRISEISNLQTKYNERAKEGIPDELRDQYTENIQSNTAQQLAANKTRRGGLIGVSGIEKGAVQGYKDLLAMDAQQRLVNEQAALGFENSAIGQRDVLANRGLNYQIGNQEQNYVTDLSQAYSNEDYAMALQGAGEQMRYSAMEGTVNAFNDAGRFAASGGLDGIMGANNQQRVSVSPMATNGVPTSVPNPSGMGGFSNTPNGYFAPMESIGIGQIPTSNNLGGFSYSPQNYAQPTQQSYGLNPLSQSGTFNPIFK